jgi:predicted nuclease with TOPRIM domain
LGIDPGKRPSQPNLPPCDEPENLTFYDLIEENDNLTQNVLDKMEVIKEVEAENKRLLENNRRLISELIDVRKAVTEMKIAKEYKPLIKYDRWWNASFEFWPGAWGLSYYRYKWEKYGSDSREGSIQLGPVGFSWNREPKKRG